MITLLNQQDITLDEQWVHDLMREILTITSYETFDIGLLFTTDKEMADYNQKYRNQSGPTDILSFSYYPTHTPGTPIKASSPEEQNLGDLILAPQYIQSYCTKESIDFEHRLMILLIHGVCHLLGYDHETDEDHAQMQSLEESILKKIPSSLRR